MTNLNDILYEGSTELVEFEGRPHTLGNVIDKKHVYKVHRDDHGNGKFTHNKHDVFHSLEDAKRVAGNMRKGNSSKVKITRHERSTLAGPKGKLPESVEIDEVSMAALGHAAEREYADHGSAASSPKKHKYLVKHKTSGKVLSIHKDAPSAVVARNKVGNADTHSVIKEDTMDVKEQVSDLLDAIDSGKTMDIEQSFNAIMAAKMSDAIDAKRVEIAGSLFDAGK